MFINYITPDPSTSRYEPKNMGEAMEFARAIVDSGTIPHLRSVEAAFIVLATGAELGLSAMQSLRCIHVIDNRPSLSADLVVALVKRSPVCRWFRLVSSDTVSATYETQRRNEPAPTRYTYTLDDARRAGLLSKNPWRLYPSAMLRARAASTLARMVYPDLVAGLIDDDLDIQQAQQAQQIQPPLPPSAFSEPDALQGELLIAHDPDAQRAAAARRAPAARKARRAAPSAASHHVAAPGAAAQAVEEQAARLLKQAKQARALALKGMNTREAARLVAERLIDRALYPDLPAAMQALAAAVSGATPLQEATTDHILAAWLTLDSPITPPGASAPSAPIAPVVAAGAAAVAA
jgi:hypothetical protein